ncbi:MAG: VTC domain-containing protein [Planctomycetota bacterium]
MKPTPLPLPEHEIKFALDARRVPQVLARLVARCLPEEPHARGVVTSIYYDDLAWRAVAEKRNSDYLKAKVRVRWYRDEASGEALGRSFLEAKRRIGTSRRKLRLPCALAPAQLERLPLSAPELADLPAALAAEGFTPSPGLLPAFQITYARHRFVEPRSGARISLDSAIRVERTNPLRLPPPRPFALPEAVLEVKGGHRDLPPALFDLLRLGCRRASFSKFAAGFDWIRGALPHAAGGVA